MAIPGLSAGEAFRPPQVAETPEGGLCSRAVSSSPKTMRPWTTYTHKVSRAKPCAGSCRIASPDAHRKSTRAGGIDFRPRDALCAALRHREQTNSREAPLPGIETLQNAARRVRVVAWPASLDSVRGPQWGGAATAASATTRLPILLKGGVALLTIDREADNARVP